MRAPRSRAASLGALRRVAPAVAAVLGCILPLALGCASLRFGVGDEPYERLAKANDAASEKLAFGLTLPEATAVMGEAEVRPPWANSLEIGPQVVTNPFDTLNFESPEGEQYVVRRYVVQLSGEARCPFVRGDAVLVPLIFFEEKLVGWRWAYLESVMQRRLLSDERGWSFGRFCDGAG